MIKIWNLTFLLVLAWSAIAPKEYFTWFLEVAPAIIAFFVINYILFVRKAPITPLLYALMLVHAIILMIGGHYTYAEVPFFEVFKEWGWAERNNFDKVGHFAQGFVPAICFREILVCYNVVNGRAWLAVVVVSICLAFSAFYELVEWWVAVGTGEAAEAFLGTQGYVWDTQSDMLLALIGAVVALVFFSRMHSRQLDDIKRRT